MFLLKSKKKKEKKKKNKIKKLNDSFVIFKCVQNKTSLKKNF